MHSRWPRLDGLAYGGDYNPEQWPEEVWERGRGADARGRGHAGHRRDLLLGHARAAAGRVRVRLARPGARPAARRRDRGRPGHPDGRAAALVPAPAPGGPPGHPGRAGARRRVPAGLLPVKPRVRRAPPPGSPAQLARATATIPRSCSGTSTTSTAHRSASATARPRAAAFRDWLRDRYGDLDDAERAWGAALLVPAVRRLGRDRRAADLPHRGQPGPAAGLRAVQLRRAARLLPARAGHPARAVAGHPGHHQLHGRQLQERRLLAVGAGGRRGLQRQLPDRRAPPTATSTWRCPPT